MTQIDTLSNHPIHFFNGFKNPYGGSELETLTLYKLLHQKSDVQLWSTSSRNSSDLLQRYPIKRIALHRFNFPRGGTYVFFGVHWRNKLWPYIVPSPKRLIYIFNTFHPKIVSLTKKIPAMLRWPEPEFVFISEFQRKLLDMKGTIHPSPININQFVPITTKRNERFVIGRLSRDIPDKHHEEDIEIYQEFANAGYEIKLQGATCLKNKFPSNNQIFLFPEGHQPAEQFLSELDVFYYRTVAHVETFGRVVLEAMACGLPVVCHYYGGYADHIKHGENGFIFETSQQARSILRELKANPELRTRVGTNARKTVEELYSPCAMENRLKFYCEP